MSRIASILSLLYSSSYAKSLRTLKDEVIIHKEDGTNVGPFYLYSFYSSANIGKNSTKEANLCLAPTWASYKEDCVDKLGGLEKDWVVFNRFN